MSSSVTLVSSMEALIPGSSLRSEIDIRLGESDGRVGEDGAWLDDNTGYGCLSREVDSCDISPNNG